MKGSLHNIVFAGVLGIVCAALLTGAARFTAPYIEDNRRAEKIRNILGVFEIPFPAGAKYEQLKELYDANVEPADFERATRFRHVPAGGSGKAEAVAVHFAGKGLWAPIRGFVALDPELTTIRGLTFYEHEETPGLGGEIGTKDFTERFKGRKVRDLAGKTGIRIVRSGAKGPNEIDGLSGATMTCEKVEGMLNRAIEQVVKERANGE